MKVFEATPIGQLTLENRLLMAPVKTGFGAPERTSAWKVARTL